MKQCPLCKRTYADETLLYCLDDGSVLGVAYDSEATQVMPFPRITNGPATPVSTTAPTPPYPPPSYPPQPGRTQWPLYAFLTLLLLLVGGGAIALLIFGYSRLQDSSSGNLNQSSFTQSAPAQNSPSPSLPYQSLPSPNTRPQSSPSVSSTPQSSQLVGTWRTNVIENNERTEITYTFSADGASTAVFKDREGQTVTHYGSWRYSDATLFETFADGATGKGAIKWIDHDNFEITIIDNGVPLYSGLKRRYRRVSDAGR